jgi:hypothetical protein
MIFLWILASLTVASIPVCLVWHSYTASRWATLVAHFPISGPARGVCFRQFVWVQDVGFRADLAIFATAEGLYFRPWLLERWLFRPFFLPWTAANNAMPARKGLFRGFRFDVGSPRMATIWLPRKMFLMCAPESLTMRSS